MKRLIAIVPGLLFATLAIAADNGVISKPSRYTVSETIDRFEALAKSKGVSIFARIDHASEATKVGLTMRPAQLLIFGNPRVGTPLMNAAPESAIDLPLKVLAWEDSQGHVWLSYNSPEWLRQRHGLPDELMNGVAAVGTLVNQAAQ